MAAKDLQFKAKETQKQHIFKTLQATCNQECLLTQNIEVEMNQNHVAKIEMN